MKLEDRKKLGRMAINVNSGLVQGYIPAEYMALGVKFLRAIQDLHDVSQNWVSIADGKRDFSPTGAVAYQKIKDLILKDSF